MLYTIAGYPILQWIFAHFSPININKTPLFTPVSIIVCVRNEISHIHKRIENILFMEYPPDFLELIIVSDGSIDGTNEAVEDYGDTRIKLITLTSPSGKAVALNAGIEAASHDVLIFGDARQTFKPDVAERLISHFNDPRVGAVSGRLVIQPAHGDGAAAGIGSAYWNYEVRLRNNEAATDSVIGVTGAIYALRKACFSPLPQGTILDDLLIPMRAVMQGYRIAYDAEAIAIDTRPVDTASELSRKIRTLYGNLQLICLAPELFLPWKNRLWFRFISHKILRLFMPAMLVGCLLSSLFAGGFLTAFGILQLVCWGGAWIALKTGNTSLLGKALSAFLLLNVAVILAWKCFLTGNDNVWRTASSNLVSTPTGGNRQ